MMIRCLVWGAMMMVAVASAAGETSCPMPERVRVALNGPIRPGTLRIVEVDSTGYACWLRLGQRALKQRDFQKAERAYRKALQIVPDGTDALLGLAAVAVSQHQPQRARRYYRRVLAIDPANPYALAGLGLLLERQRPRHLAALQQLLRQHDGPALRFALGNLYAGNGDWRRAQQAYFQAFRLDPGQPDYAYNLAVSLDRLGKYRLAARFYDRALRLARENPSGFDPEAARRRLSQLRKGLP
ncbi:MAG TPA: tetratricopeptide repeat protein [Methylothermaceae bacterium]|nr:tetratricopeptide repeat protein [Methylothermaceae bacterium]